MAEDPRVAAIDDRLAPADRIVAVTGSKGGIGKSVVAACLALAAADAGSRVGLFDLDFTSPTSHVILGVDPAVPAEVFGIEPVDAGGIAVMSVACFSGATPAPLRGVDATNALLELLAITRWSSLDLLVIDMPPGLGDTALDVIRFIRRAEFLVVGGSSPVVIASVERALRLLGEVGASIVGVVENMHRSGTVVAELAARYHVPFLGAVPFDTEVEAGLGDPDHLRATAAFRAVAGMAQSLTAGRA